MRFPLLVLLFFAPIPVLGALNLASAARGDGFEPLGDNIISYFMLFVVFGAAALAIAAIRDFRKPQPFASSLAWFVIAGMLGSGALTTLADLSGAYSTPTGVGWAWPSTGMVLGGCFGAVYGMLRHWTARHVV